MHYSSQLDEQFTVVFMTVSHSAQMLLKIEKCIPISHVTLETVPKYANIERPTSSQLYASLKPCVFCILIFVVFFLVFRVVCGLLQHLCLHDCIVFEGLFLHPSGSVQMNYCACLFPFRVRFWFSFTMDDMHTSRDEDCSPRCRYFEQTLILNYFK